MPLLLKSGLTAKTSDISGTLKTGVVAALHEWYVVQKRPGLMPPEMLVKRGHHLDGEHFPDS
jgi:hypothetical protein